MQIQNRLRRQRGAALIEYGLLVAGVALVAVAAISILGHKTSDLVATVATVLPGAHADDNNPIASGKLVETAVQHGAISVDAAGIVDNSGKPRLGNNLGTDLENLVVEPPSSGGP
jgi:pilus assembly protein Flp/PilA